MKSYSDPKKHLALALSLHYSIWQDEPSLATEIHHCKNTLSDFIDLQTVVDSLLEVLWTQSDLKSQDQGLYATATHSFRQKLSARLNPPKLQKWRVCGQLNQTTP